MAEQGKYKIVRELGTGGTGTVYEASRRDHPSIRRALKVLNPELARQKDLLAGFVKQAERLAGLVHPHIVMVHEIDEDDRLGTYIVMDLVEGQSLRELITKKGPLAYLEVLRIGGQIASALQVAHGANIVHRDVKPQNILIEQRTGKALLGEFFLSASSVPSQKFGANVGEPSASLARRADAGISGIFRGGATPPGALRAGDIGAELLTRDTSESAQDIADATASRQFVGTPRYACPEQLREEPAHPRWDIYAMGAVLYEALSGCIYLHGLQQNEILWAAFDPSFQPRFEYPKPPPEEFDRLVRDCLNRDPKQRIASAAELMRRIEECRNAYVSVQTSPASGAIESLQMEAKRSIEALQDEIRSLDIRSVDRTPLEEIDTQLREIAMDNAAGRGAKALAEIEALRERLRAVRRNGDVAQRQQQEAVRAALVDQLRAMLAASAVDPEAVVGAARRAAEALLAHLPAAEADAVRALRAAADALTAVRSEIPAFRDAEDTRVLARAAALSAGDHALRRRVASLMAEAERRFEERRWSDAAERYAAAAAEWQALEGQSRESAMRREEVEAAHRRMERSRADRQREADEGSLTSVGYADRPGDGGNADSEYTQFGTLKAAQPAVITDNRIDNVQFTVYRPDSVQVNRWYTLLAYAHLGERSVDAPTDEADPVEAVVNDAAVRLGDAIGAYEKKTADSLVALPPAGEITFIPDVPGIEFNPPGATFRFVESVHRSEFRLRVQDASAGAVARGRLSAFWGIILLADVPLAIRVEQASSHAPKPVHHVPAHARCYEKVFVSYSHEDTPIVEMVEECAQSVGLQYLRDMRDIRVGKVWSERLAELISQADVFQLFWSTNSMRSPYVRDEWEYAVSLSRTDFIRPVYWEHPFPKAEGLPPESLKRLQFQPLLLAPRLLANLGSADRRRSSAPPVRRGRGVEWTETRPAPPASEDHTVLSGRPPPMPRPPGREHTGDPGRLPPLIPHPPSSPATPAAPAGFSHHDDATAVVGNTRAVGEDQETIILARNVDPRFSLRRLQPAGNSEIVSLGRDAYLIGRDPSSDVRLYSPSASRQHARLTLRDRTWYLAPCEGKTVIANGKVVSGEVCLVHNMRLQFGADELLVLDRDSSTESGLAVRPPAIESHLGYWWVIVAGAGAILLAAVAWLVLSTT